MKTTALLERMLFLAESGVPEVPPYADTRTAVEEALAEVKELERVGAAMVGFAEAFADPPTLFRYGNAVSSAVVESAREAVADWTALTAQPGDLT